MEASRPVGFEKLLDLRVSWVDRVPVSGILEDARRIGTIASVYLDEQCFPLVILKGEDGCFYVRRVTELHMSPYQLRG